MNKNPQQNISNLIQKHIKKAVYNFFWHQGLVACNTIFPWTGGRESGMVQVVMRVKGSGRWSCAWVHLPFTSCCVAQFLLGCGPLVCSPGSGDSCIKRIIHCDQTGFIPVVQGWFNIHKLINVEKNQLINWKKKWHDHFNRYWKSFWQNSTSIYNFNISKLGI